LLRFAVLLLLLVLGVEVHLEVAEDLLFLLLLLLVSVDEVALDLLCLLPVGQHPLLVAWDELLVLRVEAVDVLLVHPHWECLGSLWGGIFEGRNLARFRAGLELTELLPLVLSAFVVLLALIVLVGVVEALPTPWGHVAPVELRPASATSAVVVYASTPSSS
jgi:hypothetical protein